MKKLVIAIIGGFLITVQAEPEIKGTAKDLENYLNKINKDVVLRVSSKTTVKADEVYVNFSIGCEEDSLKEAIEENSEILRKITVYLGESGIKGENIKAKAYSTLPAYSFYSKKPTSFTAKKMVSVRIHSESELLKVLNVLDKFDDETRFINLSFRFSEREDIDQKLLSENLQKIAKKKATFEAGLGVKLEAKGFHESRPINNTPRYHSPKIQKNYLSTKSLQTNNTDIVWRAEDHNQEAFAEREIIKELTVIYRIK